MKRICALITSALFLFGCSGSGITLPDIDLITEEDATAAFDIATAAGDPYGQYCAAYLAQRGERPSVDIDLAGPFSAYMAARALRLRVEAGVPHDLRMKCGPMLLDSRAAFGRLLLRAGVP